MMSNNSSNVNGNVGSKKTRDNDPAEQGDATGAVNTVGFNHHSNSLDKRQNRNFSMLIKGQTYPVHFAKR